MKQYQPVAPAVTPISFFNRIANAFSRAVDGALNRVFSLTHRVAGIRWRALTTGLLLAWMISVFLVVPGARWESAMRDLLTSLTDPQALANTLATIFFTMLFHPAVIRHMLALYLPFWLMHRITASYLADIFEVNETVARRFIMQAAFGRGYSSIHISQGKVSEADQELVIIQIGGPGTVVVDLDSAVLFEKPDGTPRVIGPTSGTVIDPFERIRRVVDLPDSIEPIEQAPARSRDGIIVNARDVHFSYSIYRGPNPERSAKKPYPFDKSAVENLVYRNTRIVKPGIAPTKAPEWQSDPFKMAGSIRAELGMFINKRGLSEFLADIGKPEEDSLATREQQIEQTSHQLSGTPGSPEGIAPLKAGKFTSRPDLTSMFYKQDDFQERMAKKGFQLNWIGVGTWHTPAEIIPANHREAWKISRENILRGNPDALQGLREESKLQELLRLINSIPIYKFYEELRQEEDEKLAHELLLEYEKLLDRAVDLFKRGSDALDLRFANIIGQGARLFERSSRPDEADYDNFLQWLWSLSDLPVDVFDEQIPMYLQQAPLLYEALKSRLEEEDLHFLQEVLRLHEDLKAYNQIQLVLEAIRRILYPHHPIGTI